jgi:hypothetical protein
MVNSTRGGVRNTDPWTSHVAASSIDASKLESMVYQVIYRYGKVGCISDQVRDDLNMDNNSITPRFAPLTRKGLIIDTGYARIAQSRRPQTVWVAKDFIEDWKKEYTDEL